MPHASAPCTELDPTPSDLHESTSFEVWTFRVARSVSRGGVLVFCAKHMVGTPTIELVPSGGDRDRLKMESVQRHLRLSDDDFSSTWHVGGDFGWRAGFMQRHEVADTDVSTSWCGAHRLPNIAEPGLPGCIDSSRCERGTAALNSWVPSRITNGSPVVFTTGPNLRESRACARRMCG